MLENFPVVLVHAVFAFLGFGAKGGDRGVLADHAQGTGLLGPGAPVGAYLWPFQRWQKGSIPDLRHDIWVHLEVRMHFLDLFLVNFLLD